MKAVIQRVKRARVGTEEIGRGLLILVGLERGDTPDKFPRFVRKMVNLRIFEDERGKLNLSVKDIDGEILIVSNFTLAGDVRKGNRPSFANAMPADEAREMYSKLVDMFKEAFPSVKTGQFQTYMEVELVNAGPVTIIYSD